MNMRGDAVVGDKYASYINSEEKLHEVYSHEDCW